MGKMLHPSKDQSDYWDLKMASINFKDFNNNELLNEILIGEYDLIQFNIDRKNNKFYNDIIKHNFYSYLNYVSVLCEVELNDKKLNEVDKYQGLYLKRYSKNKNEELMKYLIYEVMKGTSPFYFKTDISANVFPVNKLFPLHASYGSSFDQNLDTDKDGFIAYNNKDVPVGFIIFNYLNKTTAEAYMGGVLPEYRLENFGRQIYMRAYRDFLIPKGINKVQATVQVQNIANLKTASLDGEGMLPKKEIFKYNILPLLNVSKKDKIKGKFKDIQIFKNQLFNAGYFVSEIKHLNQFESDDVIISYPIYKNDLVLMLVKKMKGDVCINASYFKFLKRE